MKQPGPAQKPLENISGRGYKRVLILATRQIGDVLMVTPLIHTLRTAWPEAEIDIVVFRNKGEILQGNKDINRIIEIEERATFRQQWTLVKQIFRKYDLSVSTLPGDRPTLYGFLAAQTRIGIVPEKESQSLWKYWVNHAWTLLDNRETHTITQNLILAELLGMTPLYSIIPPETTTSLEVIRQQIGMDSDVSSYVVIHPLPMWRYKRWSREGWTTLIQSLNDRGLQCVLSGGPGDEERTYCEDLTRGFRDNVFNAAGDLSFAELSLLISNASCYVGPDTSVTHLAAATGIPVVAIYGPSNPVKWGPWPVDYASANPPFSVYSERPQINNNVILIQPGHRNNCVPCFEEGCDRHKESHSECLQGLPADLVVEQVHKVMGLC